MSGVDTLPRVAAPKCEPGKWILCPATLNTPNMVYCCGHTPNHPGPCYFVAREEWTALRDAQLEVTALQVERMAESDRLDLSRYMSIAEAAAHHRIAECSIYLAVSEGRIKMESVEIVPGKRVNLLLRDSVTAYKGMPRKAKR